MLNFIKFYHKIDEIFEFEVFVVLAVWAGLSKSCCMNNIQCMNVVFDLDLLSFFSFFLDIMPYAHKDILGMLHC